MNFNRTTLTYIGVGVGSAAAGAAGLKGYQMITESVSQLTKGQAKNLYTAISDYLSAKGEESKQKFKNLEEAVHEYRKCTFKDELEIVFKELRTAVTVLSALESGDERFKDEKLIESMRTTLHFYGNKMADIANGKGHKPWWKAMF